VICVADTTVYELAATVPKANAEAPVNSVPVTVTEVPPNTVPVAGLTALTVGAGAYVNWSALDVTDVPAGVVTVTSTTPALPAGAVAVQICVVEQVTAVAAFAPNTTVDEPTTNPDPVIVTAVPPATGAPDGATAFTTGTNDGDTATPYGPAPTAIAAPGVPVATVIGVTVFDPLFVTYAVTPVAENATPYGLLPTAMAVPGVLVATVIGVTVFEP
jgi:hypothetical protein